MAKKTWMVYAYVPVNVRVKAPTAKKAEKLALSALNYTRPLDLSTDDDGVAMHIDDSTASKLESEVKTAELDKDSANLDCIS